MTKRTRIILIAVGAAIGLPVLMFAIYLLMNLQGVIEPFEVNAATCSKKVLVASQGSTYKNALLGRVVERVRGKDVYLKVVDSTALAPEDPETWDAVVVVASIQASSLPSSTREFLKAVKHPERVVVIATSGDGAKVGEAKDMDAITSASSVDKLDEELATIFARLEKTLGMKL